MSETTLQTRVDQSPGITDEAIEKVRGLIGVWLRRDIHTPQVAEPVSMHDIRRWAIYSMGDDNPLWCDEEYAKRTVWGRPIAPPTFPFVIDTNTVAPGLPGVQWIYGGSRLTQYRPISPGDRIVARARLIKVEEKAGRRVPRMVLQTGETLYLNQRDELVSRIETDILRVPRARSGQGYRESRPAKESGAAAKDRTVYTDEQIEEIRQQYLTEQRRGAEPRYWEDVQPGDELATIVKGPLTMVDIVGFYTGRRTSYQPLKLAYLQRERQPANVYVSPVTRIPVHPAAGHFDAEIAEEIGMPGIYDQGWMRVNWVSHLVTNWCGDFGFIRRLEVRLGVPNRLGDATWLGGRVLDRDHADGEHTVRIECWGENQRGERNVEATVTVRLPARDVEDRFLLEHPTGA